MNQEQENSRAHRDIVCTRPSLPYIPHAWERIGLALRLGFSLFATYGDVGTDAFMTYEMYKVGRVDLGNASLIAMAFSMVSQV